MEGRRSLPFRPRAGPAVPTVRCTSRRPPRAARAGLLAIGLTWWLNAGVDFVGLCTSAAPAARNPGSRELTVRHAGDGLLDRFLRVTKANVNKVLQAFEDPEKILDQAVEDMQADLIRVRQSYAEVLATQRRLNTQREQQDQLAREWYRRAELAVEKGDDELAKEALTRRQAAVTKAQDLSNQVKVLSSNVDKLLESVKSLEEKITSARDEKEQLIARARSAQATVQVNEMLSGVGMSSGSTAFDRMKEKVEILETRAEVSEGLLPDASSRGNLEDRFKQLESGNIVDDELAKLKGSKVLPGERFPHSNTLEDVRKKLTEGS